MNRIRNHWHAAYRNQHHGVSRQTRRTDTEGSRVDFNGHNDLRDAETFARKGPSTLSGCLLRRHGRNLAPSPGVPRTKRLRLKGCASVPDMSLLEKHLAPYGLCRARVHESWSDFSELPLPAIAKAPPNWQARVGWAGRFEKVPANAAANPAKPHHLGRGKSGKVVRMRERSTGRDVAVKKFQDRDGFPGSAANRATNEFEVAHKLRHPQVVAPLAMALDKMRGKAYLVYPLVDGETLAKTPSLTEPVARQVMRDICEALAYLFAKGVTHNDVRGDNIIIRKGRGYLIDFGLSSESDELLHRGDLRMLRNTMSHFWPVDRSMEAHKFLVWFKERVEKTDGLALIQEVLAHPYLHQRCATRSAC